MKYTINLRDTKDGATRAVEIESEDDDHGMAFWWCEGNMSCDCNRSLYLSDHEWELDCSIGRGNRIVVDSISREDGAEVPLPDDANDG